MYVTPKDAHFVEFDGHSILLRTMILIVHTLLYGNFFLLFCISTAIFIRRGLTSRTKWIMLIITIICFALFSSYWTTHVVILIISIKSQRPVDNHNTIPNAKFSRHSLMIIGEVIAELLPIINDMVVVWRTWIIFPSQRRLMIAPIIILICTIVITILRLLSFVNRVPALLATSNHHSAHIINGFFVTTTAASIATNLTATFLISYNLWDHRKHTSGKFGHEGSRSQGERILAVLIESGAIYCVIQVIRLILLALYKHRAINHALYVFGPIFVGASAMYPVIVVILVHFRLSFEHTYGLSLVSQAQEEHEHKNTYRTPTTEQLRFAPAPSNSITSRESREILEESREESNV